MESIFAFLAKGLDLVTSIFKAKNTDVMVNNDQAQKKQELNKRLTNDVNEKDVKKTRTDLTV